MDDKLASLITYVQGHPHVVRVELQASEIFRFVILSRLQLPDAGDSSWYDGICNGMPKTLSAIAKLMRVRLIPFLGLTGNGLEDFDGRMIAAAHEDAPSRVSMEQERLRSISLP